ncbi:MAG: hypothetical protein AB7G06_08465 [Bdellovibrionales bacterium]
MTLPIRLCLFLFPLAYGLLALAFGQDANWDLRNYHWYNAYAFLNGRYGFDLLPSQTPYFYNPMLDLPLYLSAQLLGARPLAFLLGALQGLNFVLLFTLARRLMRVEIPNRDSYALLVAFAGLIGGGVLGELGTCFYDNVVSLGVLATLNIIVLRLGQSDERRNFRVSAWKWLIAGVPLGLVSGFKLPTAVYAVGIGLALVVYAAPLTERFRRGFFFALGLGLGFLVAMGPWGLYLWQEFQNPLFPYFNDIFNSPLAPPTSARDIKFLAEGWEKLYFPFLFTMDPLQVGEVAWRDIKIPLVYALLPLALVLWKVPGRIGYNAANDLTNARRAFVLWAGAFSYVVWMLMFAIYRYAIPLEMLSALMLFITIDLLKLHAGRKRSIYVGLVFIALATMQVADWGRADFRRDFVKVTGADIPAPDTAMLLMAGFQPYSHVIPAFPAQIPVIRVQSNFASPGEPKGINPVIKARVRNHAGNFWLLVPTYDTEWVSRDVLPQFGLKTVLDSCRIVRNNLGEDLNLCPVQRVI